MPVVTANPGNVSVTTAQPGNISGVTTAQPGNISGVTVAHPGNVSVTNAAQLGQNQNYINNAQAQQSNNDSQIQSLLASIRSLNNQINNKPLAPTLDINAIRSQANSAAQSNVNPLYTQKLNEYLQNEAANTAAQQELNKTNISNYQAQLANTMAGSDIQRTSTQQNTQAAVGNINATEQNYLQTQGNAYTARRAQLLQGLGSSGLATSGIGQGRDIQAQVDQALNEKSQQQQYNYGREQQNLLQTQTFAQLANSDELSKLKETQAENTANFNLNDYLRQSSFGEQQFREQNEQERQTAIQQQTSQGTASQVANFISSFKNNPALYNAAIQAYGGLAGGG